MEISAELLALITCPVSGGALEYDRENKILISQEAGLTFPVIDGIPMLLKSLATKIPTKVKVAG